MNILNISVLIGAIGLSFLGCKQAKYEFVDKPGQTVDGPSTTLQPVSPNNNEYYGENQFKMKITPFPAKANQNVSFSGACGNAATAQLSWEYGDGKSGLGNSTTHKYLSQGQYTVTAYCKDSAGKIRRGNIVLTVGKSSTAPNQNPGQTPIQQ
jgi:hypothetical protein